MEIIDYVKVPVNIMQGDGDGRQWRCRELKNNLVLIEEHQTFIKYGRILMVNGPRLP